uniref:Reverse transcriptase domain-containing protein n=2 Tax=Aegilops tauschii subsp. strangulata TaxID=200361 RepID=A0A453KYM4_AEGTS
MIVKGCEGKRGGLALMWKRHVNAKLHNYSRYHIDMEIVEQDGYKWQFTGVYGEPSSDKKDNTWKLLKILNQQLNLPWLCAGDFIEVLYGHEKKGGPGRSQRSMEKFRMALLECGLRDLGYSGDKYTWRNNSHEARFYIKERLDQAVATREWCARFPSYQVTNGDPRHSDHRPVTISVEGTKRQSRRLGNGNTFRFEAKWLEEEECEDIVTNAWNTANIRSGGSVAQGIKSVSRDLKAWDANVLGDLQWRIKKLKDELEMVRRSEINQDKVDPEHVLKDKLDRLEKQHNLFWRQRAHVKWLQFGDKNTAFFHACASEKKKRNTIQKLKKEDGTWVEEAEQLNEYISNYYLNIFTSAARHDNNTILQSIQPRVTDQMNELLCAKYTEEEVRAALNNIGDLKAPGPNGMPAIFFKRFWNTVGEQVTKEVLKVLRGGEMPEEWNNTIIVLIPKMPKPARLNDLRPISLCNVVYKLIAKVLTNRLKNILPEIISPNQSAFVPGRVISDNILLAYEMIHFLQRKKSGRGGYAAIKLNMSKAYDRVEWKFLQEIMLKLGFNRRWVQLVMNCVTTVKYQIKINGDVTEIIIPERGLCQDDSLLLLEANANSAHELNQILNVYEAFSGQVINKEKSAILFSKNTKREDKEELMNQLNIATEGFSGKYLGLPCYIGKSKSKAFEYIKERVWKRIQGGKEKMLSKAGKEILIKAVAQAIPVYAMACFDLTKYLCDDISSMIGKFWWSQMDKENKIHWVGWDKLTKPKKDGGLGFRDLYSFNLAMLARQAWRMLQSPASLCAQVFVAKYYPNQNLLQARPRDGISYSWRSILKGVQVLQSGIIWRVGDGCTINIWSDPWLPRGISRSVTSQQGSHVITKVSDLIDSTSGTWDIQLL